MQFKDSKYDKHCKMILRFVYTTAPMTSKWVKHIATYYMIVCVIYCMTHLFQGIK